MLDLVAEPQKNAPPQGGVYALGNFDGVHRGHRAVVKAAIDKARAIGASARVLTFEPHPRSFFKPDLPPFRLTPAATKIRLLKALGIDDVIVEPFTPQLSQLSAQDFVERILIQRYGAQHTVAGFDFVFGHGRGGDMKQLRNWLAPHKIGVTEVTPFRDARGEIMSSSRTRDALRHGETATAEHILGRAWSISGVVERGAGRGAELEARTANIALGEHLRPQFGVYAVHAARVGDPFLRQGVGNIGTRPTVDGKNELLEFHLFNFNEDIYGQEWEVELIDFIRPEQAFANLEALRSQIARDIEAAKVKLAARAK
ncbi:MAG: bifunctional riboflavin kinase/FAD synthetase [Alphaproteobacteria bacterium]|nr:bifunctional riboflavin kinase/FAD synthetase [Alphaproteobacteria bacterium]